MRTASSAEANSCCPLAFEPIEPPHFPVLTPLPSVICAQSLVTDQNQRQSLRIANQPVNSFVDDVRDAANGQGNTSETQQRVMLQVASTSAGVENGTTTRFVNALTQINKSVDDRLESSGEPRLSIAERFPIASSLCAGAFAGAIAKTVIAPLDRTKINFQIRHIPYSLPKAFHFLGESYRKDGLSSWWRGNTATMARVIPYAALQYTAHEQWKKTLRVETREERRKRPFMGFVAGSLAGVTASSLTYPLDLARARMAVSRCEMYKNLGEVFLKIWHHEGPQALYRGFVPSLLGVVPYAGASFFTYEWLKHHRLDLKKQCESRGRLVESRNANSRATETTEKVSVPGELHPMERLACGAIAGLIGQSCSYPLDIVRRRMQTSRLTGKNYRTIRGTILHIWKHEGLRRGLFKGLSNFVNVFEIG
ncbi:mitochondrial coenzyme A transporter SLC25A42-like isoform X2 [Varroa jacobsoni]|uniref:mitochondrial coenzyme A transporter SLC25A42-like isoform X2 n=1 Tax=Varroa jacobsoni TaxID=62625 RepID=UPI000BF9DEEF|nr:mitochondrial coenzyme A transporter SLC25A42-like isoform X2 [Varroa jacobsoni]